MVKLIIDRKPVSVPEGTTILEAARSVNIEIPTLCYLKGINEIAACRLCMVEIEGYPRLVPSCDNVVAEGMVVHTNSPRAREARRVNMRLLLSQHDTHCTKCTRSGNCKLQKLTNDYNLLGDHYIKDLKTTEDDFSNPVVRIENRCVRCMRCVQVCDKIQSMNIWDLMGTGSRTTIGVGKTRRLGDSDCTFCGQCIIHCPVGALQERDDTGRVFDALADPKKITVVQIAPAVRAAWAEYYHLDPKFATAQRMVTALKQIGFDYVFDTDFAADLTIMEESAEFLERVKAGANLPLMTSCCPAWVKFVENEYPEFKENISTCRSPQAMFSAILKDYYRDEANAKGKKTVVVSVMPCTAKKMEAERKESYTHEEKDTDYVLTTTELIRMIDAHGINFEALPSESCDMPFGIGSGGGVIFGATGGVTEAVLRRLIEGHDPATLRAIAECGARGDEGIREFSVPYNGLDVKICVASGLANARKVLESVKSGEKEYHFIEVMACPGGCVMGGGQPVYGTKVRRAETRTKGLYEADGGMAIKKSNENPLMDVFYNGYFKGKAHELLHNPHE